MNLYGHHVATLASEEICNFSIHLYSRLLFFFFSLKMITRVTHDGNCTRLRFLAPTKLKVFGPHTRQLPQTCNSASGFE